MREARPFAPIASNKAFAEKLGELEKHLEGHDASITEIVKLLQWLMQPDGPLKKNRIGFIHDSNDGQR